MVALVSPTPKRKKCRRCRRRPAGVAKRGLCWRCWHLPDSAAKYPSKLRVGLAADNRTPRVPAEPTGTMPGSLARMRVYHGRILRGEAIHHPGDANDYALAERPFEANSRKRRGSWKPGEPTGLE